MTRRVAPQPGVDRMVSPSWSGRRRSSPVARQGRALARGLEGRLPLQHHHASDQNSSSSRCRASFSLALKHGIYREPLLNGIIVPRRGRRSATKKETVREEVYQNRRRSSKELFSGPRACERCRPRRNAEVEALEDARILFADRAEPHRYGGLRLGALLGA